VIIALSTFAALGSPDYASFPARLPETAAPCLRHAAAAHNFDGDLVATAVKLTNATTPGRP
jgi:hypothetical protein